MQKNKLLKLILFSACLLLTYKVDAVEESQKKEKIKSVHNAAQNDTNHIDSNMSRSTAFDSDAYVNAKEVDSQFDSTITANEIEETKKNVVLKSVNNTVHDDINSNAIPDLGATKKIKEFEDYFSKSFLPTIMNDDSSGDDSSGDISSLIRPTQVPATVQLIRDKRSLLDELKMDYMRSIGLDGVKIEQGTKPGTHFIVKNDAKTDREKFILDCCNVINFSGPYAPNDVHLIKRDLANHPKFSEMFSRFMSDIQNTTTDLFHTIMGTIDAAEYLGRVCSTGQKLTNEPIIVKQLEEENAQKQDESSKNDVEMIDTMQNIGAMQIEKDSKYNDKEIKYLLSGHFEGTNKVERSNIVESCIKKYVERRTKAPMTFSFTDDGRLTMLHCPFIPVEITDEGMHFIWLGLPDIALEAMKKNIESNPRIQEDLDLKFKDVVENEIVQGVKLKIDDRILGPSIPMSGVITEPPIAPGKIFVIKGDSEDIKGEIKKLINVVTVIGKHAGPDAAFNRETLFKSKHSFGVITGLFNRMINEGDAVNDFIKHEVHTKEDYSNLIEKIQNGFSFLPEGHPLIEKPLMLSLTHKGCAIWFSYPFLVLKMTGQEAHCIWLGLSDKNLNDMKNITKSPGIRDALIHPQLRK